MIWIGLAIVLATFWLIYKNYEARLVLTLSGVLMALIGQVALGHRRRSEPRLTPS